MSKKQVATTYGGLFKIKELTAYVKSADRIFIGRDENGMILLSDCCSVVAAFVPDVSPVNEAIFKRLGRFPEKGEAFSAEKNVPGIRPEKLETLKKFFPDHTADSIAVDDTRLSVELENGKSCRIYRADTYNQFIYTLIDSNYHNMIARHEQAVNVAGSKRSLLSFTGGYVSEECEKFAVCPVNYDTIPCLV